MTNKFTPEQSKVLSYMRSYAYLVSDPITGETNLTQLAEDSAHHFKHDEWLDDPDHWVWELSARFAPR